MHPRSRRHRHVLGAIWGLVLVACAVALAFWLHGAAKAERQEVENHSLPAEIAGFNVEASPQLQDDEPSHPAPDLACRLCHGDSTSEIEFPSGERLPVAIDLDALEESAHGTHAGVPLLCTACHQEANYQIPHPALEATDLRGFEIERATTCERCHQQAHLTSHAGPDSDSPVVCTDCHGSHEVLTVDQWQDGEGTEACIACHTEAGVELTDPIQLTEIIRGGMFAEQVDKTYCLACHSQPGLTMTFENGDVLPLTIDAAALHDSVHGVDNPWQPLDCTDCHDRYVFPHERPPATSLREYNLQRYTFCAECHQRNYERALDSVHGAAIEEGNLNAAVCTDCHGAHDIPPPNEPRERISFTCRQCHSAIFDTYSESVHGNALLTDSNPDVPTCIDCHGVHDIHDPTTNLARLRSPELCAGCHANEELMARYDISTDVFQTYVADFHGETVTLFEEHADPNVETNKAVCYDCHGVHDIRPVDDPENGIKANLLETCRQCHPNASPNFPDAWTSHFQPSLEHNPLVFLINTFYAMIIPLTLGGLGFLIATDIFGKVRRRFKE